MERSRGTKEATEERLPPGASGILIQMSAPERDRCLHELMDTLQSIRGKEKKRLLGELLSGVSPTEVMDLDASERAVQFRQLVGKAQSMDGQLPRPLRDVLIAWYRTAVVQSTSHFKADLARAKRSQSKKPLTDQEIRERLRLDE